MPQPWGLTHVEPLHSDAAIPQVKSMNRFALFGLASLHLLLLSCQAHNVEGIAQRVENVGRYLDDFGSVSVSSPVFADPDKADSHFGFDFNDPDQSKPFSAKKFYDDARTDVHGRIGALVQQASDTRIGVQIRADLQALTLNMMKLSQYYHDKGLYERGEHAKEIAELFGLVIPAVDPKFNQLLSATSQATAAEPPATQPTQDQINSAMQRFQDVERLRALMDAFRTASGRLPGADSRPSLPDFGPSSMPTIDPNLLPDPKDVKEVLAGNAKFERFQALLSQMFTPTTQPVVPNRSALITAGGDMMVMKILQFLGHPEVAGRFQDKVVLMGVSMVGVAPGTKTQQGYIGEVSVSVGYDFQPVRQQVLEELLARRDLHTIQIRNAAQLLAKRSASGQLSENRVRADELRARRAVLSTQFHNASEQDKPRIKQELDQINSQLAGIDNTGVTLGAEQFARLAEESVKNARFRTVRPGRSPSRLAGQADLYTYDLVTPYDAFNLSNRVTAAPVVAAVSPMTEVQTLDLASSIREQQAFAMKLAIAVSGFGAEGQAAGLFQYIEQLQQDAITRTPLNTVAGFSNSAGVFGYQVGPSVVGLAAAEGARRKGGLAGIFDEMLVGRFRPGPGMLLQRQSFPVIVFVGIDADDLRLRLQYDPNSGFWSIVEPRLQFRQATRWIPIPSGPSDPPFTGLTRPNVSEADRIRWANQLRQATNAIDQMDFDEWTGLGSAARENDPKSLEDTPADAAFKDFVRHRIATLHAHALEAYHYQAIPISAFLARYEKKQP